MANNLDIKCDKDGVKPFDSIALRKYESCPKSSWTHVILFKITAALSGEYFDKEYYNVYVYTSEQYTFLYWSYHYIFIAYTGRKAQSDIEY